MMYAAGKFPWKESSGTLILAGLVHEETDDIGMNEFLELGLTPDYAIFGEPSTVDRICIGYRGRVWTKLTISTEPGHTTSSWDYENAIVLFYDLYQKIQSFTEDLNNSQTQIKTSSYSGDKSFQRDFGYFIYHSSRNSE